MAKGRKFAPSTKTGKHWFCVRPWAEKLDKPRSNTLPSVSQPKGLPSTASEICRGGFPFSRHDNRNAFQSHGISFFENVSGKKMLPALKYKCSGDGLLPSLMTETPRSCYTASYGKPRPKTPLKHVRYPHEHTVRSSDAQRRYDPKKSTILTSFGAPYTTPLHVLAITQEPFLRANTWVYSHKPKVYNRLLGP
ncbi:uncharacterized protein LOC114515802 [Dendronephthya gigantea]|uniref:uncharacterized protein LOC114515802 n=1 Tax=Dendronephthya gigantea TaxID=151771 RepID=UPI00106A5B88|nr:uncharacterized protein LOC114515802 [Dendronephthya gigantea]